VLWFWRGLLRVNGSAPVNKPISPAGIVCLNRTYYAQQLLAHNNKRHTVIISLIHHHHAQHRGRHKQAISWKEASPATVRAPPRRAPLPRGGHGGEARNWRCSPRHLHRRRWRSERKPQRRPARPQRQHLDGRLRRLIAAGPDVVGRQARLSLFSRCIDVRLSLQLLLEGWGGCGLFMSAFVSAFEWCVLPCSVVAIASVAYIDFFCTRVLMILYGYTSIHAYNFFVRLLEQF
jgi:hypothetical protein